MAWYWSAILYPLFVFQSFLEKQEQKPFSATWWLSVVQPVSGIRRGAGCLLVSGAQMLCCWLSCAHMLQLALRRLYERSSISELCQASLQLTEHGVLWSQLCWLVPAHWSARRNIKGKHVVVCYWYEDKNTQAEEGRDEGVEPSRGLVRHAASL